MSDEEAPQQKKRKESHEKRRVGFSKRCVILALESIALVLGIGTLLLFVFIFMLSRGPIGADFLVPYIEKTLNNVQGRMSVSMDAVQLEWKGDGNELILNVFGVNLRNDMGVFLTINQAKLQIPVTSLLKRNLSFDAASIIGMSMRVDRYKDGSYHIFNNAQGQFGPPARSNALTLDRIIDNLPPIQNISVVESSATYYDHLTMQKKLLSNIMLSLVKGGGEDAERNVSGYLQFSTAAQKDGERFSLDFLYDDSLKEMMLSGRLGQSDLPELLKYIDVAVDVPDFEARGIDIPFDARGNIRLSNDWQLLGMNFAAKAERGKINLPDESVSEIALKDVQINLGYSPITNSVTIDNLSVNVSDVEINATAQIDISTTSDTAINIETEIAILSLEVDKFDQLVPDSLSEEPLYKWMVLKLSDGVFKDLTVNITASGQQVPIENLSVNQETSKSTGQLEPVYVELFEISEGEAMPIPVRKPSWDAIMNNDFEQEDLLRLDEFYSNVSNKEMSWLWNDPDVSARFGFEGLKIDYRPPMMPASNARGTAELNGKALTLSVDSASIGKMNVISGDLYFDDLVTKGEGNADIKLKVQAKTIDAFDFLAREPIDFGKHMRFDQNNVRGDAMLDVGIKFPTVRGVEVEDIKIDVNGQLTDTVLPGVLKGMSLAGGPFKLTATQDQYRMTGKGRLDGRPIDLNWHSYFSQGQNRPYEGRIQAKMGVDDDFMARLGVDITEYVSGDMAIDLDMTEDWSGRSDISVKADLSNAKLYVPVFDYTSSARNVGVLRASVVLQDEKLQKIEELSIASRDIVVEQGNLSFVSKSGGDVRLDQAEFKKLRFAENNFALKLQQARAGLMKIDINGEKFDARSFLSQSDANDTSADDDPFEVGLKAKTVLTDDHQSIQNVSAYVKGAEGKLQQLEVDAVVGRGALYVRYKPNMEDRYSLRIEADDAGATLEAFGMTDKVTGGKLTVAGIPTLQGYYGDVRGLLRIDDFNVRAAPALASIIKLMDLPTVMTSLNSKGLDFARLETEFEWLNRKGGGLITVKDGRTSGGSIGLTFEGDMNRTLNKININGTIVPASTLNSFFSGIPLVGQILSGGSGSIFAATYSMTGSMSDPKTRVNPLSVLAPGIIRRILFEGGN